MKSITKKEPVTKSRDESGTSNIKTYLLYLLVAVAAGIFAYVLTLNSGNDSAGIPAAGTAGKDSAGSDSSGQNPPGEDSSAGFQPIVTGTAGTGDVAVELKPHLPTGGVLSIDISLDTHSVDLSQFDLKKITSLMYGSTGDSDTNGSAITVKPVDAPGLSGHHSSGILTFNVGEDSSRLAAGFTVTIEGIPAEQKRVFEWT